jgi:hypothetical protein
MKSSRLQERMRESVAKGLAIEYQATDEDLPATFWPDVEKEFWDKLEGSLNGSKD